MGFVQEFKDFAMRGNVVDMAVGIILGAAFGKIVSSAVEDVIMPPIGKMMGGVDFSQLKKVIQPGGEPTEDGGVTEEIAIRYGEFINVVIDFLIVALAIFMAIKVMNSLKKDEPEEAAAPPKEEVLLTEIRDLLAKKN